MIGYRLSSLSIPALLITLLLPLYHGLTTTATTTHKINAVTTTTAPKTRVTWTTRGRSTTTAITATTATTATTEMEETEAPPITTTKTVMAVAAESRRISRARGDAALFADWTSGLESSAGNRTLTASSQPIPVALPFRAATGRTATSIATARPSTDRSSASRRNLELDLPAMQVAESHEQDFDGGNAGSLLEDPAFGDGYNLGYRASPGESGTYKPIGVSISASDSVGYKSSASESGAYTGWGDRGGSGGGYQYAAHSYPEASSYPQQDYGKGDYYNKPSYQPAEYSGSGSSYSGNNNNELLLAALALKSRRERERSRSNDGDQMGLLLAGLPFLLSMSSGSTGLFGNTGIFGKK
ncbi:hypothetical protein BV898_09965 [Hypsibius exemplaris]|uniref:Uncharacterized protein n=1 Tax=Hypsibius exemplaris TaxID=2072580 RepID=A0A1W0WL16_HYPEX|nr:hypothetical protein BV898_09965 [Hypsibius exemplaris]